MAAMAIAGGSGKRLVYKIQAASAAALDAGHRRTAAAFLSSSLAAHTNKLRATHSSAYDKEIDDQLRPMAVPDYMLESEPGKYWSPHPKTGVFSPEVEPGALGSSIRPPVAPAAASGPSVLDQKVWFRQLEDVEKPHY